MQGFQITFFTEEGRRHAGQAMSQWLMGTLRSLGVRGATVSAGVEGIGRDGRMHSAHFFELADQPIAVTVALTEAQLEQLFAVLEREHANLFYIKTPVEFGVIGRPRA
jgi:PII-like signaling protein